MVGLKKANSENYEILAKKYKRRTPFGAGFRKKIKGFERKTWGKP